MRSASMPGLFYASLKTPTAEDLEDYCGSWAVIQPPGPDDPQSVWFGPYYFDETGE